MEKGLLTLTIFFENGFYHGLFGEVQGGELFVSRVTFGAEPKVSEVLDLIHHDFDKLLFSPGVRQDQNWKRVNPKRLQRLAHKEMNQSSFSTKSHEALAIQREALKKESRHRSKQHKALEAERKFALKQKKRREKHRGH